MYFKLIENRYLSDRRVSPGYSITVKFKGDRILCAQFGKTIVNTYKMCAIFVMNIIIKLFRKGGLFKGTMYWIYIL